MWSTELTPLPTYHLVEKPCQVACEAPLLNENSTAIAIGTIDQMMYSQVKPSIAHGRRHGFPPGRPGSGNVRPARRGAYRLVDAACHQAYSLDARAVLIT